MVHRVLRDGDEGGSFLASGLPRGLRVRARRPALGVATERPIRSFSALHSLFLHLDSLHLSSIAFRTQAVFGFASFFEKHDARHVCLATDSGQRTRATLKFVKLKFGF